MHKYVVTMLLAGLLWAPAFASTDNPGETTFSLAYDNLDDGGYSLQGVGALRFEMGAYLKVGGAARADYVKSEKGAETVKAYAVGLDARAYLGMETGLFVGAQVLMALGDADGWLIVPQFGIVLGDETVFVELRAEKTINTGDDRDDLNLDAYQGSVGIGLRF